MRGPRMGDMTDAIYHVYILANRTRRLYVGVTGNLRRRLWQHRTGQLAGFTRRYNVTTLVYVESYRDVARAIAREKQLKRWPRRRKERLIEMGNPGWEDLATAWNLVGPPESRTGRIGERDRGHVPGGTHVATAAPRHRPPRPSSHMGWTPG